MITPAQIKSSSATKATLQAAEHEIDLQLEAFFKQPENAYLCIIFRSGDTPSWLFNERVMNVLIELYAHNGWFVKRKSGSKMFGRRGYWRFSMVENPVNIDDGE